MGYKLKRIMMRPNGVEKQVRPSKQIYTYSYDFRNKSSTDITNAGWKIYGTPVTSSNGVTCNTGTDVGFLYPILASNAKKITIETTATYIQGNDRAFAFGLQLEDAKYSSNSATFYLASSTIYNGTKVRLIQSNTIIDGTNIGSIGTSSYKPKLVIDLTNKEIEGSVSGFNNSTLSLTDAQVELIRSMPFIYLYTTQKNFYLQDLSITIE